MPYEYVEPERLVKHEGVEVFYTYKGNTALSFWYCVRDDQSVTGWTSFDVREVWHGLGDCAEMLADISCGCDYRVVHALVISTAITLAMIKARDDGCIVNPFDNFMLWMENHVDLVEHQDAS